MIYGNIVAARQQNLKRMLAYSSIAHSGYVSVGTLCRRDRFSGHHLLYVHLHPDEYRCFWHAWNGRACNILTQIWKPGEDWANHLALFCRRPGHIFVLFGRDSPSCGIHGQVRSIHLRHQWRSHPSGYYRDSDLGDRSLLLHPGDRVDVLQQQRKCS